jgi:hypothetical protein
LHSPLLAPIANSCYHNGVWKSASSLGCTGDS